jgi:hypothetical protein
MNVTWMVLSGLGMLFLIITWVFRDELLSSELARMGGGLRSHLTGKGISNPMGGNHTFSDGGVMDSVDEEGRPIMRGTRSILS